MGTNATPLVEVATFTAAVYPPQAATAVLAADVITGEQALANRTRYLYDNRLRSIQNAYDEVVGASWVTTSFVALAGMSVSVTDCLVGDILLVSGNTTVTMNGTSADGAEIALFANDNATGDVQIYGARALVPKNLTATTWSVPFGLSSLWVVLAAGTTVVNWKGRCIDAADNCTPAMFAMTVQKARGY